MLVSLNRHSTVDGHGKILAPIIVSLTKIGTVLGVLLWAPGLAAIASAVAVSSQNYAPA